MLAQTDVPGFQLRPEHSIDALDREWAKIDNASWARQQLGLLWSSDHYVAFSPSYRTGRATGSERSADLVDKILI